MTVVKVEDEEYFTPDVRDSCCQAFGDGNDSLQEACIVYILDTTSNIIFDNIERTCTMVSDNEVLFRLPSDRLTTVKIGNIIEYNEASLDQCCKLFVSGDDSMEGACLSETMVSMELTYDDINKCRSRTVTRTFYTFPEAMIHAKTETEEQS